MSKNETRVVPYPVTVSMIGAGLRESSMMRKNDVPLDEIYRFVNVIIESAPQSLESPQDKPIYEFNEEEVPIFSHQPHELCTLVTPERCNALVKTIADHKKALPTCDIHKPDGGSRSGCMICALQTLSAALSRIDYACGEPNEMRMSDYDLHCNEEAVVEHVQTRIATLEKANVKLREDYEKALARIKQLEELG